MTFYYFAYGSNMLLKRMRINNPSAQFKSIAELKKYKIGFAGFSKLWCGSPATIIDSEASSVWGVLWEVSKDDEDNLNRQEVGYNPLYVTVESPTLGMVKCKSYQHISFETGEDGLPSLVYKNVMIHGAKEHGLPQGYVKKLENTPDNGYKDKIDLEIYL